MANGLPASIYLLALSAGIITHRFLNELLPDWILAISIIASLLISIYFNPLKVLLLFLIGLLWTNLIAGNLLEKTIDRELEKQDVVVSGKIIGVPISRPRYKRFDFFVDSLEYSGKNFPSPGRIRLKTYYNLEDFKAGQRWQFTVRLKKARGFQNPGSRFNYETYLFEHRIRATGYVREEMTNKLLSTQNRYSIPGFRERVSEFINLHLGEHPTHGILTALVVGIRGSMDDDSWRVLQNTGTIHLVAISGLHIGLISGLVMWFASRVWRLTGNVQLKLPALTMGVMAGLVAGCSYAVLAGMTIPTRRAVVMLSAVVVSLLLRRKPIVYELLIVVLTAVLLIDPLTPLANGFWLSFGAVAVIIFCVSRTSRQPGMGWAVGQKIKAWISIQLFLGLGLAPLLLIIFNQVSVVAPLANLIAIPVIGFLVVPLALFALFVFAVGAENVAITIFKIAQLIIDTLWSVLEFISASNWAIYSPPRLPTWMILLAAVGVVILFLRSAFPARISGVILITPLLFFRPGQLNPGEFKFTMLEVGHGLASVIETQNHVLIYDTGPAFSGGLDTGKTVALPYLKSRGINFIDIAIVSHQHNDHAGGYQSIKNEIKIARTFAGVPESISDSTQCHADQSWNWDGVHFEILWTSKDSRREGNNASCIVRIDSKFGSLLLTADIEKEVEAILVIDSSDKLQTNVLQIPHHGSKTSSTQNFLQAVNPDFGVLSSGYLNRFGHPHNIVLQRYDKAKIPVISTASAGAISVFFGEKLSILSQRNALNGYWFSRN